MDSSFARAGAPGLAGHSASLLLSPGKDGKKSPDVLHKNDVTMSLQDSSVLLPAVCIIRRDP